MCPGRPCCMQQGTATTSQARRWPTHRRPSSMPGPRKEAALVRLALSKELLNTSFTPRLSAGRPGKPREATKGFRSRAPHCSNTSASYGGRERSPCKDQAALFSVCFTQDRTPATLPAVVAPVTALIWRHILSACASDWITLGPAMRKNGCEALSSWKKGDSSCGAAEPATSQELG